jgi:hypothetical protein
MAARKFDPVPVTVTSFCGSPGASARSPNPRCRNVGSPGLSVTTTVHVSGSNSWGYGLGAPGSRSTRSELASVPSTAMKSWVNGQAALAAL